MGIVFVMVLQLFIFALLAAFLWIASRVVIRKLSISSRFWRRTLQFAPLALPALVIGAEFATLAWQNYAPANVMFTRVFGRETAGRISGLHASTDAWNDSAETFLSFRTSPETLSELIQGLRAADNAGSNDLVPMPGDPSQIPSWWRAHFCGDRSVWAAKNIHQWDQLVVTACHADGKIYVQARWIE